MKKPFVIRVFQSGLGDLIVQHGMLRHLCENGYNVHLLCKSKAQEHLAWLSPYVASARYLEDFSAEDFNQKDALLVQENSFIEKDYYWGDQRFIDTFGKINMREIVSMMYGGIKSKYNYEHTPFPSDAVSHPRIKFVALCPGGRRETKKWDTENWVKVADDLQEKGYFPVVIGNPYHKGSEQVHELVERGVPRITTDSMQELVDIITRSVGVVTIDNGLMHLATCQSTPTVALFGPMKPWLWGTKKATIKNLISNCNYNCSVKPLDWKCDYANPTCVNRIKVEHVLENLYWIMGREA